MPRSSARQSLSRANGLASFDSCPAPRRHALEQGDDVCIPHPDTSEGDRPSNEIFFVHAMDVDQAPHRIDVAAPIHLRLEPLEQKNTGEHPIPHREALAKSPIEDFAGPSAT